MSTGRKDTSQRPQNQPARRPNRAKQYGRKLTPQELQQIAQWHQQAEVRARKSNNGGIQL